MQWLAAQGHITPSTFDRYRGTVENYIVPRWGTTTLAAVRHAEVQAWVTKLGSDLSPSSVEKVHRVFSLIMAWAVTDERITKNPAAGIRIRRAALPDHRYLDDATVARLAKACEDYAPLVRLLAYTGLRWGEAAALRVKRVDLVRRRLVVAESVTEVNGRLVWGASKTHARRTVPLPRFLVLRPRTTRGGQGARRPRLHRAPRRRSARAELPAQHLRPGRPARRTGRLPPARARAHRRIARSLPAPT